MALTDEDDEGDDKGGGADDVAVAYEAEGDGGDDVDAELADVERQLAELNELLHGVNDLHGGIDFLTFGTLLCDPNGITLNHARYRSVDLTAHDLSPVQLFVAPAVPVWSQGV